MSNLDALLHQPDFADAEYRRYLADRSSVPPAQSPSETASPATITQLLAICSSPDIGGDRMPTA